MNKFLSPKNIEQLVDCLKEKDENIFLVAGGTDLSIKINEKKVFDYNLIELCNVEEMKKIELLEDDIIIGAAVTMTEIEKSDIIKQHIPALALAAYNLGSTQIRNRATIGGNVCNASQSADCLPVLFAYNAMSEIIDEMGNVRKEKVEDVVIGLDKSTLGNKDVVTKFIIKKSSDISSFSKVGARTSVTISKINCCVKLNISDSRVKNAIVYIGAVGAKPIKADLIEKNLLEKTITENIILELKESIREQVLKAIPNRDSRHYKKEAAIGVIEDALLIIKDKM